MSRRRSLPRAGRALTPAPTTTASQAKSAKKRERQADRYAHWAEMNGLDPTSTVTWCAYVVMYVLHLGRSHSHMRAIRTAVRRRYETSGDPTQGPLAGAVMTCVRRREKALKSARGASGRLTSAVADEVFRVRPACGQGGPHRTAERVTRAAALLSLAADRPWSSFTSLLVRDVRLLDPRPQPRAAGPHRAAGGTATAAEHILHRPCGCPPHPPSLQLTLDGGSVLLECTGDQLCPVDAVAAVLSLHDDDDALLLGLTQSSDGFRIATPAATTKRLRRGLRATRDRLPGLHADGPGGCPDVRLLDTAGRLLFADALDPMFAFPSRDSAWAHLLRAVGRREQEVTSADTATMSRGEDGWDVLMTLNKRRGPRPGRTAQPPSVVEVIRVATDPDAVRALDRWWLVLAAVRPDPARPGQPAPGPFIPVLEGKHAFRRPAKPGSLNPVLTEASRRLALPRISSQGGKRDHLTAGAQAGEPVHALAARGRHAYDDTTWLHYLDWSATEQVHRVLDPRLLPPTGEPRDTPDDRDESAAWEGE